jgi:two-component system, OmpR family, sensor histidine kinase MprB
VSLRTRLVLAFVALTTAATVAVGAWSYAATVDRLYAEIDRSLADIAAIAQDLGPRSPSGDLDQGSGGSGPPGENVFFSQVIDGTGSPVRSEAGLVLPVDALDSALAAGADRTAQASRDLALTEGRYRLLTVALDPGPGAIQVARSLDELDRVADSLRFGIVVAVLVVGILAALAGWLLARQLTLRLERLVRATDEVTASGDLEVTVPVEGSDEIAALGASFAGMLGSLRQSREAQRRLVQDAGHELRTPLTSVRTNIAVLRRHPDLAEEDRSRLVDDLDAEARELSVLVNELVDLAAERRDDEPVEEVVLGELVERAATRARRRSGREIIVTTDGSVVMGRPGALERAVTNLLDNATKFDASGGPIRVDVAAGTVAVSDGGPGIPEADLPMVFDRFYRSDDARSRPGSGLGLAIVRDVAEAHGGTVFATGPEGGGARVGFSVPVLPG